MLNAWLLQINIFKLISHLFLFSLLKILIENAGQILPIDGLLFALGCKKSINAAIKRRHHVFDKSVANGSTRLKRVIEQRGGVPKLISWLSLAQHPPERNLIRINLLIETKPWQKKKNLMAFEVCDVNQSAYWGRVATLNVKQFDNNLKCVLM